MPSYLLT